MYLVPQDRPLVIAARVDLIHIDELVPGQQVTLRLSALDQRTTPELYGQVVQISADAFEDSATGQSYYRVEITLNPGEMDKLATRHAGRGLHQDRGAFADGISGQAGRGLFCPGVPRKLTRPLPVGGFPG